MFKTIHLKPLVLGLGLLAAAGQVSAHVFPGGSTMTFDNGANASTFGSSTPGPAAASIFPAFGQSYVEQNIQFSAIGFGTVPGNSIGNVAGGGSHVHGEIQASATDPNNHVIALLADSGGGMFQLADHSAFGFGGVDVASMNLNLVNGGQTTMTFRGYTSADYSTWFDVTLAGGGDGLTPTITQGPCVTAVCTEAGNGTNGFLGTHLHMDNFAEMQNVYLVEYFYDVLGRGNDGSLNPNLGNLVIRLDNLQLTAPAAVPLPAAAWLFGTGLLGLFGIGGRRRKPGEATAC